ncbi:hypothetical protein HaLaN_14742 [Haematococcus lacustris]|uniref:Uncharacterized protein n=1 Tax=Haematococcus lacustris TaxID=44745 RepID=A0A699ZF45_HAELA|nr:hypothetical protein HaLaN_14742 [Haematococcus lacustris]
MRFEAFCSAVCQTARAAMHIMQRPSQPQPELISGLQDFPNCCFEMFAQGMACLMKLLGAACIALSYLPPELCLRGTHPISSSALPHMSVRSCREGEEMQRTKIGG